MYIESKEKISFWSIVLAVEWEEKSNAVTDLCVFSAVLGFFLRDIWEITHIHCMKQLICTFMQYPNSKHIAF